MRGCRKRLYCLHGCLFRALPSLIFYIVRATSATSFIGDFFQDETWIACQPAIIEIKLTAWQ